MAIKAGRRCRDSHLCNHLNDHRRTIPGKHLATENIRGQLVARGIQPNSARKAAMFQLAGEIPTPILAEMLGLSTQTATRWAALVARDWTRAPGATS